METKHTPLPWHLEDVATEWPCIVSRHHDSIAAVDCSSSNPRSVQSDEVRLANAEFIVRACNSHYELLEALKACLRDADSKEPIHPRSRHTLSMATQQMAREAIAKATL